MADNKKYISKIVKGQDTLYIKDEEARQAIVGGMHFIGVSSTAIADGDSTGPWTIGGVTYIASGTPSSGQVLLSAGDVAIYGSAEFVWGGSPAAWREFGDMSALGDLAYADTASATYTPQGSNAASAVSFSPAGDSYTQFVTGFNQAPVAPSFSEGSFDAGSLPSFTEGAFDAGSLPSLGNATTGNFNTDAEKTSYNESTETLTISDASASAAVTAQGTFDAGSLPSKAADTFSAGTLPSKSADTWDAGTVPTLSKASAITPSDSAEAAAQTFTGTQATITVTPDE